MKKLSYIFLTAVILFALFQFAKYNETLNLIWNNADVDLVKHQAKIDSMK